MQDKVNIWNSVATRFALFFIFLLVATILISGYLVYRESSRVIVRQSQEQIKHTADLAQQAFYSFLDEVSRDIDLLSDNPIVEAYVKNPKSLEQFQIEQLVSSVLKKNKSYYQIRLINADTTGQEIIRFDKIEGQVIKTKKERLQEKGSRDYFKESIRLKKGEFYFSSINLNEEYGRVSLPIIPTLRAGMAIYDNNDEMKYILMLNVDLNAFYEELRQIMGEHIRLVLVDSQDQFLFAPNMNVCFGQQLNTGHSFLTEFDFSIHDSLFHEEVYPDIVDQQGSSAIAYRTPLPYYYDQKLIYLVSIIEKSQVYQSSRTVQQKSILWVIALCAIALILAIIFTRYFSSRIQVITSALRNYESEEKLPEELKVQEKRNDEIGVLARSFRKMRETIDRQLGDLQASINKEQQAVREKDEFLQNMSHELRTPLNAISGLTDLLSKNEPTDQQKPIIEALKRSSTSLSGLMYDILDHQKLIEGKLEIKYAPCDLAQVLEDIHASYHFDAIQKGLQFELEIDATLRKNKYLSDPLRLSQIVTNLTVNALKFTEKGKVVLSTSIDEQGQIKISVSDTGIGIQPDNLEKIKIRFFREDSSLNQAEGFGLGLSIVRHLVGLFGGSLHIESQWGQGSEFTVHLPATVSNEKQVDSKEVVSKQNWPLFNGRYKVIHLEDDPSAQLLVKSLLENEQIEVIQTSKLQDLIEQISHGIDLVISDLMIEDHSIVQDIRKLMNDHGSIPFVCISAFDRLELPDLGAHYLQKPFDGEEPQSLIYTLLGNKEWQPPVMKDIYHQYDNETQKITNYLDILLIEFSKYESRIADLKKEDEWKAIKHKIVTHINSLKLESLRPSFEKEFDKISEEDVKEILNQLRYYQCFFRTEKMTISRS